MIGTVLRPDAPVIVFDPGGHTPPRCQRGKTQHHYHYYYHHDTDFTGAIATNTCSIATNTAPCHLGSTWTGLGLRLEDNYHQQEQHLEAPEDRVSHSFVHAMLSNFFFCSTLDKEKQKNYLKVQQRFGSLMEAVFYAPQNNKFSQHCVILPFCPAQTTAWENFAAAEQGKSESTMIVADEKKLCFALRERLHYFYFHYFYCTTLVILSDLQCLITGKQGRGIICYCLFLFFWVCWGIQWIQETNNKLCRQDVPESASVSQVVAIVCERRRSCWEIYTKEKREGCYSDSTTQSTTTTTTAKETKTTTTTTTTTTTKVQSLDKCTGILVYDGGKVDSNKFYTYKGHKKGNGEVLACRKSGGMGKHIATDPFMIKELGGKQEDYLQADTCRLRQYASFFNAKKVNSNVTFALLRDVPGEGAMKKEPGGKSEARLEGGRERRGKLQAAFQCLATELAATSVAQPIMAAKQSVVQVQDLDADISESEEGMPKTEGNSQPSSPTAVDTSSPTKGAGGKA